MNDLDYSEKKDFRKDFSHLWIVDVCPQRFSGLSYNNLRPRDFIFEPIICDLRESSKNDQRQVQGDFCPLISKLCRRKGFDDGEAL